MNQNQQSRRKFLGTIAAMGLLTGCDEESGSSGSSSSGGAFVLPTHNALLIGDSQRMLYEKWVRHNLHGSPIQLHSFGLINNGRIRAVEGLMTGTTVATINPYRVSAAQFDCIHMNAGLHDSLYYTFFYPDRTTLDMYKASMENILSTMWGENFAVKVILATCTPPAPSAVPLYGSERIGMLMEFNDYIRSLGEQGLVTVNDLYQFVIDNQLPFIDGNHLAPEGSEAVGYEVARYIREAISA